MTNKTITIIFIFLAAIANAQPIITAGEANPQPEEIFEFSYTSLVFGEHGNAGPNVTWDFSDIDPASDGPFTLLPPPIEYVDPAVTGYAADFPEANLARLGSQDYAWHMYRADETGLYLVGRAFLSNFDPGVYVYTDPRLEYFWPATYGDIETDAFATSLTNPDAFTYTDISGTQTAEVDAYGDLLFSDTVIEDVLRFKIVREIEESIFIDNSPLPPTEVINNYTIESYAWYKEGIHFPVLSLGYTYTNGQLIDVNSLRLENTTTCATSYFILLDHVADEYVDASSYIISPRVVPTGVTVTYNAGQSIRLTPGFHAQPGSTFHAFNDGCDSDMMLSGGQASDIIAQKEKTGNINMPIPPEITDNTSAESRIEQSVGEENQEFGLHNLYDAVKLFPNPTTSFTTLSIELKETKQVSISVTDILGQEVMAVANQQLTAGVHDFTIDLSAFTKGVYLIKSEIDDLINTQRVILK